jgi:transposase
MRIDVHAQREIARLHSCGQLSTRQISLMVGHSPSTVTKLRERLRQAGISWDALNALDDAAFFNALGTHNDQQARRKPAPDWAWVHAEMQKPDVTLYLLWGEWHATHPDGICYSQFTDSYRQFVRGLPRSMRQTHPPGEKLFVDFCGRTVPIHNQYDGSIRQAQVFVAVLGASSYNFSRAVWSQTIPDWIRCHVEALHFFGGVPRILVPDNLKSAVLTNNRFKLHLNDSYRRFAAYYGCGILPARPRKPQDKAKVENGVQITQRWILAALRNQVFFSLEELNQAIDRLLHSLNHRPFKKLPGCRRERFEALYQPALMPLPANPYEFADVRINVRVGKDYHVEYERHFYSVPSALANQRVDIHATARTVEFLHGHKRVASHPRSDVVGGHTTDPAHLSDPHRYYAEGQPAALLAWAATAGSATLEHVTHQLQARTDFGKGLRAAQTIRRLAREYGEPRLEEACAHALRIHSFTIASLRSILRQSPDKRADSSSFVPPITAHDNLRGAGYFSKDEPSC